MLRVLCSALAALAIACALASPGAARPFTVDDLLHQESIGEIAVDPSGRWLVFEQRGPYDTAPRYDLHFATSQTLARLQVVDLLAPASARPLLAKDAGPGLSIGPFSPHGERLAVFRYQDRRWSLGVVSLASGEVRWFEIAPQDQRRGRALQWLSDREFLVLDRPDGWAPPDKRQDGLIIDRLQAAWAAAARGDGAHTVLGSGVYAGVRPRAPARRLLRVDAETGAVAALAEGEFIDLEVSPGGRQVALFRSGKDLAPRDDGPVRGPAGLETESTELTILDLASGHVLKPCPGCDLLPNLLAWSPSGRALLTFDRGRERVWTRGVFRRIDARTGATSPLGAGLEPQATSNPVSIRAGWMGETPIAYARDRTAGGRFDWRRLDDPQNALTAALPDGPQYVVAVSDDRLVLIADDRLVTVDRRGQASWSEATEARLARRPFPGTAGSRLVNSLPAGTWVAARVGDKPRLLWVTAAGQGDGLPQPTGRGDLVGISRAARSAVLREIDPHGVETLRVIAPKGEARAVVTLNAGLAETDAPEVAAVHHRGDRGEALTSWMFLPAPRADGARPPLIVRPYLGYSHAAPPRDLYMEQGFFQNLRMLTGHGYAVLVPSLPNPPEGMVDPTKDVAKRILAVLAAAEADPSLSLRFDPSRAGLLGWSFGGYTTLATITQTHRFRAAVAMDGISDLTVYWSALPLGRLLVPEDGYGSMGATGTVESTQPALGAPPWRALDRYVTNSPLLQADRIETPLLLIHGALDPIPMSGSLSMYSALFRQGKDAMIVIYWGANHAVAAPGDVRDVWSRTFAFLDEHLMPPSRSAPPSASPAPVSASDAPTPPPRPRS